MFWVCVRKYSDSPSDRTGRVHGEQWYENEAYENEAAKDDIKEQEQKANDLVVSVSD